MEEQKTAQKNNMFNFLMPNWPQSLQKLTIKYRVIELSEKFLNYIMEDGVFIHPKYCRKSLEMSKEDIENLDQEKFTQFEDEIYEQIQKVLEEFGSVFMKINWKAPLDCTNWAQDLKIEHTEDLINLLKNSGVLTDMLLDYKDQFFEENQENQLEQQKKQPKFIMILKKFYNINAKREYRCFVYKNKLVAVCQKNTGDFYKELKEEGETKLKSIQEFFEKNLKNVFTEENYVFDLYYDVSGKQKLIDIDPWQEFTNPLLFTFEELEAHSGEEVLFKYIQDLNSTVIRDYSVYRVPEELAHEESNQENMEKILELMKNGNLESDFFQ